VQLTQLKRDLSGEGNGSNLVDIDTNDNNVARGNSTAFGDVKQSQLYSIEVIVVDRGEGNYGVRYTCPHTGVYAIDVRVYGELISHMPKLVTVTNASMAALLCHHAMPCPSLLSIHVYAYLVHRLAPICLPHQSMMIYL
jgi:hypothetical protein